jgi:DNA-binding response OmpR family regulator
MTGSIMNSRTSLDGKTVLVVEAEPLLAIELEYWLDAAGANVLMSSLCQTALPLVERDDLCGAILEYELRDGDCRPVLARLAARNIPTVIFTAHKPDLSNFDAARVVVVDKLTLPEEIVEVLRNLVSTARDNLITRSVHSENCLAERDVQD